MRGRTPPQGTANSLSAYARLIAVTTLTEMAGRPGVLRGTGPVEVELVPQVMRDVSQVDTAVTVLGARTPLPIVLSPVEAPRMFHHEGELAVARAARHAGLPYGISTLATQPLEAVAAAAQGSPLWFQLYLWATGRPPGTWCGGPVRPATGRCC